VRCRKARWFLSARCDGTLSERQRARLDEHLKQCPSCRSEAFYFSEIAALSGKMESVSVRPDFNLRLRAAIQRQESAERTRRRWYQLNMPPVWRTAMAGAAVLALFAFSYGGYRVYVATNDTPTAAPMIQVDQNWTTTPATGELTADAALPRVPSGWTPVSGISPEAERLRERYLDARQGQSEYILETVGLDDINAQDTAPRYVMPVLRSDEVVEKVSY